MLMRMYARWAERHGFEVEIVDELRNEEAGIRSATLHVIGDYAYGYLQSETGVHRLVRISPFDSNARRQTSFAAVDVMPEIEGTIEIEIRPTTCGATRSAAAAPAASTRTRPRAACATRTCRPASPPRAAASAASTRTTTMAMKMLKAKLYQIEEQKRKAEVEKLYDEKGEVAWGYQIRNYVMQPYTLVKDVRTEVQTPQVGNVLDGEIDDFIQAYLRLKAERRHKKGK